MAKGRGICGASGHLGDKQSLLKWALGSHGHSIGCCSEAWDMLSDFLARRKVGTGLRWVLQADPYQNPYLGLPEVFLYLNATSIFEPESLTSLPTCSADVGMPAGQSL